MSRSNSGISISGGTVNAGSMAAGDHAVAYSVSGTADGAQVLAALRASLAELAREVRERSPDLSDPARAESLVGLAEDEAGKEQPNLGLVRGFLEGLGAAVGSVATLGSSVASIVETVSALAGG